MVADVHCDNQGPRAIVPSSAVMRTRGTTLLRRRRRRRRRKDEPLGPAVRAACDHDFGGDAARDVEELVDVQLVQDGAIVCAVARDALLSSSP